MHFVVRNVSLERVEYLTISLSGYPPLSSGYAKFLSGMNVTMKYMKNALSEDNKGSFFLGATLYQDETLSTYFKISKIVQGTV